MDDGILHWDTITDPFEHAIGTKWGRSRAEI